MTEETPGQSPNQVDPPADNHTISRPSARLSDVRRRVLRARIGRLPVPAVLGAIALAALLVASYQIGTPSNASTPPPDVYKRAPQFAPVAAATAAPAVLAGGDLGFTSSDSGTAKSAAGSDLAPIESQQIVKTGSMAIEVQDVEKAVSQAKATIAGMGGSVSDESRSGDGDSAVATITYRIPAAKWDDALAALRALAGRLISEQTNANDQTAEVIDLDARIKNLQATESALQAIMARATAVSDVLAVENQLSQVQGQIEQLTAQRDHIKGLAAMSTLTVSFSTPASVAAMATNEWTFGDQVDQAVAALIHVVQGLITIAVWAVVVGIPVVVGLLILWLLFVLMRRVSGRRNRPATTA